MDAWAMIRLRIHSKHRGYGNDQGALFGSGRAALSTGAGVAGGFIGTDVDFRFPWPGSGLAGLAT